jgi:chemotaxis protein methyltransferase CheR
LERGGKSARGRAVKAFFQSAEIESFRAAVERRLGLVWDQSKTEDLADVLRLRVAATNSTDLESYLYRLNTSIEEVRALAGHLTVPETYFFRIPDHFRVLTDIALPDRMGARRASRRLNILSAGCASGEEPYSIAMLLQGRAELSGWQVTIRGVDINSEMIAKGRAGSYSEWSLRETPRGVRQRHFRQSRRQFQLDDRVREMVVLEESNLADANATFWLQETYDVIFFRNVMMYFSLESAQAVVGRVAQSLVDGGYLFLGPAETLRGISQDFHLRHKLGAFYYQRRNRDGRPSREFAPVQREQPQVAEDAPALPKIPPNSEWFDSIRISRDRVESLARSPGQGRRAANGVAVQTQQSPAAGKVGPARRSPGDTNAVLDLLLQERFAEALDALPASGEGKINADVQLLRAVLLTNSGDIAQAESSCEMLLKGDEMNAGAHYVMALCCEHRGDRQAAMDHDQTAVYLDPSFAMPHLHLGLLGKRGGEMDVARQELNQALLLLPREDASRILLFGGGFSREALVALCRSELRACGGPA